MRYPVKPISAPADSDAHRRIATSGDYAAERKYDGIRCMVRSIEGVAAFGAQGQEIKLSEPLIDAVYGLHVPWLDCELIDKRSRLIVFDLPSISLTYTARRKLIYELIGADESFHLFRAAEVDPFDAVNTARRNGWEGIVYKRRNSVYPYVKQAGTKTTDWIKVLV
jgi:ATP-dependent DNA ligase